MGVLPVRADPAGDGRPPAQAVGFGRQLYFLIDGLLDRLVYLSYGLAAILGFIGVKLILHALHENTVPFIDDGRAVSVVEISTGVSLGVIIGVLILTTVISLFSAKGRAQNAVAGARRHATEYLDLNFTADAAERAKIFAGLCHEEEQLDVLPPKLRTRIREEEKLQTLLRRAHESHGNFTSGTSTGSS